MPDNKLDNHYPLTPLYSSDVEIRVKSTLTGEDVAPEQGYLLLQNFFSVRFKNFYR